MPMSVSDYHGNTAEISNLAIGDWAYAGYSTTFRFGVYESGLFPIDYPASFAFGSRLTDH